MNGYKHGVGRLSEPSGSYFYGYWEYNKPGNEFLLNHLVRNIIYYNADEHNWKILNLSEMVEDQDIDFYQILEKTDWKNILTKASGYPDYRIDGYKSLIDEKGLKRENLLDPEFDISESVLQIKDDNG